MKSLYKLSLIIRLCLCIALIVTPLSVATYAKEDAAETSNAATDKAAYTGGIMDTIYTNIGIGIVTIATYVLSSYGYDSFTEAAEPGSPKRVFKSWHNCLCLTYCVMTTLASGVSYTIYKVYYWWKTPPATLSSAEEFSNTEEQWASALSDHNQPTTKSDCQPFEKSKLYEQLRGKTLLYATKQAIHRGNPNACQLFASLVNEDPEVALTLLLSFDDDQKVQLLSLFDPAFVSHLLIGLRGQATNDPSSKRMLYRGHFPVTFKNGYDTVAKQVSILRTTASLCLITTLNLRSKDRLYEVISPHHLTPKQQAQLLFYPAGSTDFQLIPDKPPCFGEIKNSGYCNGAFPLPISSEELAALRLKLIERNSLEAIAQILNYGYAINPKQATAAFNNLISRMKGSGDDASLIQHIQKISGDNSVAPLLQQYEE